ncbi:unnamed protein product [Plutella xylostella]|uniref:(diamondback moth) hypothetical protein n=1 Tax=Plutella xylostella TaxID=51655 RepID=A0A8S4G083_PLUXY|nr:unnamed protein product [Plutella xylostella]
MRLQSMIVQRARHCAGRRCCAGSDQTPLHVSSDPEPLVIVTDKLEIRWSLRRGRGARGRAASSRRAGCSPPVHCQQCPAPLARRPPARRPPRPRPAPPPRRPPAPDTGRGLTATTRSTSECLDPGSYLTGAFVLIGRRNCENVPS